MKDTITLKQNLIKAFVELNNHWSGEITENENELLETGYPFHKSFDELTIDVLSWGEQDQPIKQN